jgi:hypothetical protein
VASRSAPAGRRAVAFVKYAAGCIVVRSVCNVRQTVLTKELRINKIRDKWYKMADPHKSIRLLWYTWLPLNMRGRIPTLANTFCNVPVDILSTVRWMLARSSCSVCGWYQYTVSLRCPHKKVWGGGLKSGDRGGHNLFEMRVQETQIPSKPWVA